MMRAATDRPCRRSARVSASVNRLEARIRLSAGGETYSLLERYKAQLPAIFIVSQVELILAEAQELRVEVEHGAGSKCERCWNWSETVGIDGRYPTLDERCVRQIEEGWLAS